MKTILIVWMMVGRYDVQMLYAIKYPTEQVCITEAAKHRVVESGLFGGVREVKRAECVYSAEVKS